MKQINPNLVKLVNALNEADLITGQALGEQLGISRAAVWKTIQKLQRYGIPIASVHGAGYRLLEPLVLLDERKLCAPKLEIFETLGSTNDYLRERRTEAGPRPWVCLAEHMSSGKGRLDKKWISPFGKNIYFSCLYRFHQDMSELAGLSLVVSLAILNTMTCYGIDAKVKWPNDILVNGKKCAGNLIEVIAETNGVCDAIIGVGVNVNMLPTDGDEIDQPWTSLMLERDAMIDRTLFLSRFMPILFAYLKRFEEQGFTPFLDEWAKFDAMQGELITMRRGSTQSQGMVAGINKHGHLLLDVAGKGQLAFSSGDALRVKQRSTV